MSRLTLVVAACALALASSSSAQPVLEARGPELGMPTQEAPPQQAAPRAPRAERDAEVAPRPALGKPVNVRIDVTVTEQLGSRPPSSKSLSLTTADGESAQIRNQPEVATPGPVLPAPFSVDAMPTIIDGRIRLGLSIDYNVVDASSEKAARNQVRSRQQLVLESGKPMVVSESTDPMTERKVTVTVSATILK